MSSLPSQSDPNRSLLRGLEILRAFRPGSDILGNAELAERTGLPKSTLSRLTGTLVQAGYLTYVPNQRGYSLGVAVLSLSHAMRGGSTLMQLAREPMLSEATRLKVNIGLALADREDMVYLETLRFSRSPTLRQVSSGQRVPMAMTSLGRAYLSSLPEEARKSQILLLKNKHPRGWTRMRRDIAEAIKNVEAKGWCAASWQPKVVALASPLVLSGQPVHVLNMSVHTDESFDDVCQRLSPELLKLRQSLIARWNSIEIC